MAIITINKKTFEKEIGKIDEKMQEQIALFGTPIEKIDENEIHLEIFPNRPDMLSYSGFKRSFLAFKGKKTGLRFYQVNKPEKDYQVIIDKSVSEIRPLTACAIVKGLKLNNERIKEIIEIQEKLHVTIGRKRKKVAIGIYPLEKISLPITFKALEPDKIKFIPLEMNKEISGLEILQKHPAGKEYAHLLAGKIKFPIFEDSQGQILSMPPIINSQLTGKINEKTQEIFVECSGFDFEVLEKCLNIIVSSLAEAGGKIYAMNLIGKGIKSLTPDLTPSKMEIDIKHAEQLLGIKLTEKEVKKLLERMGFNYKAGQVEIPAWRTDILHEVDIIEDIAIAYGYDNFIPEIPEISTLGKENPKESFKRKIAEILSGVGMIEISTYHLTNKSDQLEKMESKDSKEIIEIKESKTEYNLLRKNLTPNILRIFSENVDSEYPQRIFEIGKVFSEEKDKIIENENICCAMSPGNFTEIKQSIEYLFRMLGLKENLKIIETEHPEKHFIDGRTANIIYQDKTIGQIGEIHPKILKNWKLKMSVSAFEMSLEEIFENLG